MNAKNIKNIKKELPAIAEARKRYEKTGSSFNNGLLAVKEKGKWGFVDEQGVTVITPQFSSRPVFDGGGYACAFLARHQAGLIDLKGTVVIPFEYDDVKPFDKEGYAQYKTGMSWGTVDRRGRRHILPEMGFHQIGHFFNGVAPAKCGDQWGLIDQKGGKISDFIYTNIEEGVDGLFYTQMSPKHYGYLTLEGESLFKEWFEVLDHFNKRGVAVFRRGKHYGIVNNKGMILFPAMYELIERLDIELFVGHMKKDTHLISFLGLIIEVANDEEDSMPIPPDSEIERQQQLPKKNLMKENHDLN